MRRMVPLIAAALFAIAHSAQAEPPFLQEVAPGLFVHLGQIALTTPQNAGDIANMAVIVGKAAVAVIDTGGSVEVGERLRAAIKGVTGLPVRYVINTHVHPDHLFGNDAFEGATFVGHANLPRDLAERGPYYLRSFREQLGDAAIARVKLIPPILVVDDTRQLDLGDRVLTLSAWHPPAHTVDDLTVLDETTHTLIAGDLLFIAHVPVVDASVKGWLAVLARLAQVPAVRVVPGHGQVVAPFPAALEDERRYLNVLIGDTRRLIAAGVRLERAVPQIGQSERNRWALFDDYNPRNATLAYTELEWE